MTKFSAALQLPIKPVGALILVFCAEACKIPHTWKYTLHIKYLLEGMICS